MKSSKKSIAIIAILAIVCFAAFAAQMEETTEKNSGWSVNAGTSYMVSHLGGAYNLGRWEFGVNLYTGFPNLAIIGYANDSENSSFADLVKESFKIAYAGSIGALYDITKGDKFDVDLGLAVSGLYSGYLFKLGVVSFDFAARIKYNPSKHSGIYIATEIPLAGVLLMQQDSESGETTTSAVPIIALSQEFLPVIPVFMLYTTRIGYVYSF